MKQYGQLGLFILSYVTSVLRVLTYSTLLCLMLTEPHLNTYIVVGQSAGILLRWESTGLF